VTAPKQYTCQTCDAPGEYIPPARGDYAGRGAFVHLDDGAGHDFVVKPQCPKCNSFNYAYYETNWGHGNRCSDCRYDFYFSLGD
jgi:hypothetical protein